MHFAIASSAAATTTQIIIKIKRIQRCECNEASLVSYLRWQEAYHWCVSSKSEYNMLHLCSVCIMQKQKTVGWGPYLSTALILILFEFRNKNRKNSRLSPSRMTTLMMMMTMMRLVAIRPTLTWVYDFICCLHRIASRFFFSSSSPVSIMLIKCESMGVVCPAPHHCSSITKHWKRRKKRTKEKNGWKPFFCEWRMCVQYASATRRLRENTSVLFCIRRCAHLLYTHCVNVSYQMDANKVFESRPDEAEVETRREWGEWGDEKMFSSPLAQQCIQAHSTLHFDVASCQVLLQFWIVDGSVLPMAVAARWYHSIETHHAIERRRLIGFLSLSQWLVFNVFIIWITFSG